MALEKQPDVFILLNIIFKRYLMMIRSFIKTKESLINATIIELMSELSSLSNAEALTHSEKAYLNDVIEDITESLSNLKEEFL
jgi:hypothetical protein